MSEYSVRDVLLDLQYEVHGVNVNNGWFETDRTVGEDIALLHSEVSEMLEAYRSHGFKDVTGPSILSDDIRMPERPAKPEGFGSECADVLIRLLDVVHRCNVDLEFEYTRKMEYNKTRGYRHGNKLL